MAGLLLVFQCYKVLQQLGRQVVHAVIAYVFERVQGHGFARTGHTGDDHNIHGDSWWVARSISRAWARVVGVIVSPPSMRAIS